MLERAVLKEHQMFLVSDACGDVAAHNVDGQGLYWRDTRFMSLYEMRIEGCPPQLLSSTGEHNFMTNLQFTNPAFRTAAGQDVPARTVSIRRNRFLHDGLHERIGFFNYNRFPLRLRLDLHFGSDFRDMFDVRGYARREGHGRIDLPRVDGASVSLSYLGLDDVLRETSVSFDRVPDDVEVHRPDGGAEQAPVLTAGISGTGDPRAELPIQPPTATCRFDLEVPPGRFETITIRVVPRIAGLDRSEAASPGRQANGASGQVDASAAAEKSSLDDEFVIMRSSYEEWEASCTQISTDHEIFDALLRRSRHDLRLLSDRVPAGYLPSAGIPWFSVPFGRDSLITAIQTLCLQPEVARATLHFLAEHQGKVVDDWRDEQPGKILHEVRMGELASLGQVPHTPYYGSVDATPLFLIALAEYLRWTGDWDVGRAMQPSAEAALRWIDEYGDGDGDGFVEYVARAGHGLRNQGWKDSAGAISDRDGKPAEPPIALAEVQGYVYAAKRSMAWYFERLGAPKRGERLRIQAAELRRRFDAAFWQEQEGCFAIALDGAKRPVPSVSSNAGHCLWAGLVEDQRADGLGERLLREDMLSGWGVRTLSSREPTFNPMSYHNGSVWPHDNSLIVAGFKRYGMDDRAMRVADEVVDAAIRFPLYRLPELYCGFARDRRYFSMPAQYPVSCSPQAWAAGSVFLIVQSMLGLRSDADEQRLVLRPTLLGRINRLAVRGLKIGSYSVDLDVVQRGSQAVVEVDRAGPIEVVVE